MEYVRPEEMAVPQNVRKQFSTTNINTKMNNVEEANKESYYVDPVYVPEQTSVNVAAKVAAGVPYNPVDDDVVKQNQFKQAMSELKSEEVVEEEIPAPEVEE